MARPSSIAALVIVLVATTAVGGARAFFWGNNHANVTAVCSSLPLAPYKTEACSDFEGALCESVSTSCGALSCPTLSSPTGCDFATNPQVQALTSCARLNSPPTDQGDGGCGFTTAFQVREAIALSQVPVFASAEVQLTNQGRCTEPQVGGKSPSFSQRPILFQCANEGGGGSANARVVLRATCPGGTIVAQALCSRPVAGKAQAPLFQGSYGSIVECEWARPATGEPRRFFQDVMCLPVSGQLPGEDQGLVLRSRRAAAVAEEEEAMNKKP